MAAVRIEKIHSLRGEKARKFIETAEKPKKLIISEQQLKIYNHLKSFNK